MGRVRVLTVVAAVVAAGAVVGSALSRWDGVPESAAAADGVRTVAAPRERVRVEVLNGGGRPNMARSATDRLREGGFDVVYFGNAGSFDRDASVVVDRVGRPDLAREVAEALGIRAVESQPDTNLFLDVSVVLGEEWDPPAPVAPAPAAERPWWDPRGWLPRAGEPAAPVEGPRGLMADPSGEG